MCLQRNSLDEGVQLERRHQEHYSELVLLGLRDHADTRRYDCSALWRTQDLCNIGRDVRLGDAAHPNCRALRRLQCRHCPQSDHWPMSRWRFAHTAHTAVQVGAIRGEGQIV